mgnify:FL=1
MSIDRVREYFAEHGKEECVREFEVSSATVELASVAVGVIPARIAKTLSFKVGDGCALIVTAGDARTDNSKFKEFFKTKAKMLHPDEALEFTGYEVGGICPFALPSGSDVRVYTDVSLQRFETVFPAAGSANSAVKLTCDELFRYSNSLGWIDVCKGWQEDRIR